ncbi:MAG: methyltransferase [Ramlibacter sp.]|nr:methyltransferase [Ramlibacter sp.]
MYSNKLYTPLRYPGGKARFAPFIATLLMRNGLEGGHYLEPYAGGAGVALELLFHGHAAHIHINDLDPAIFDFWRAVTTQPDEILRLLHDTPVTVDEWLKWRAILRQEVPADLITRGFATLFMNRTNRSGVLKGGVIGGINQDGPYKLDARFRKDALAARIEMIALHASCISVYNEDAYSLLARARGFLPEKSLVYLDPPYYLKGQELYRNFYEHEDHAQIADLLQSSIFGFPWVVSYDNVQEIRQMYRMSRRLRYGLYYTAQARYVGSEVMIFAKGLRVPESQLPDAKVAA